MNAHEIYLAAVAISEPQQRAEFIERVCAGRSDVRAEVERMLAGDTPYPPTVPQSTAAYHEPDRTVVQSPAVGGSEMPSDRGVEARSGTVIDGKYVLMDPIGEGGMGSVWRARQTEPVKRFVAVKLI